MVVRLEQMDQSKKKRPEHLSTVLSQYNITWVGGGSLKTYTKIKNFIFS